LRGQLGTHLFELFALVGLEDLDYSAQSCGPQIVELILEAFVVVAIILQHHGDLICLFRGEIQFGLKVLKDSFPAGFPGRRGGGNTVEAVMQSIFHPQHSGGGAGQKHQKQRGCDAGVADGGTIAHGR